VRLVPDARTFALPIYAVYSSAAQASLIDVMLRGIAAVAPIHSGPAESGASQI
jgi:hypothetical protein